MDNELINRNAKRGLIDSVILGCGTEYGFNFDYRLKVKHIKEVQTGIVIRQTHTSGGYKDLNLSEVPDDIQKIAYERMPGFMEDYNKVLI